LGSGLVTRSIDKLLLKKKRKQFGKRFQEEFQWERLLLKAIMSLKKIARVFDSFGSDKETFKTFFTSTLKD
jgi:hypothetical protein